MKNSVFASFTATVLVATAALSAAPSFAKQMSPTVVIQVEQVGGFVGPNVLNSRLPQVVVYSNGVILSQHLRNGFIQEMYQGSLSAVLLRSQIATFSKASTVPPGGWGIPGVADVPSTQILVVQNGKKNLAVVYALGFTSGTLSKTVIASRLNLAKAIEKLTVLAGKTAVYKPARYEVWPLWPNSGVAPTEANTKNPAALFCLSQYGTLVAGKVLLDSPTPSPDLSVEYCHLSDGSYVEEWKYFYQLSKTGVVWPAQITPPLASCLSVSAKAFITTLRTAAAKQWLLPSGAMVDLSWRPVLPDEIACKR
jgi:putative hemolysin